VQEQEAEAPVLVYFTLEEIVIKKFEQRVQLKIATWLNKNDHKVEEPILLSQIT